jgi:hypothetical protein
MPHVWFEAPRWSRTLAVMAVKAHKKLELLSIKDAREGDK